MKESEVDRQTKKKFAPTRFCNWCKEPLPGWYHGNEKTHKGECKKRWLGNLRLTKALSKEKEKQLAQIKEKKAWQKFNKKNIKISIIISNEIIKLQKTRKIISIPAIIAYQVRMIYGISIPNKFIKYYVKKHKCEKRFWEKVNIQGDNECWEWQSTKHEFGYGQFHYKGKTVAAPRVLWEILNGKIPEGLCVLHHCDNPPCVNPVHLFLGTHKDNSQDMVQKGRQAKGEKVGGAKLTESQVLEIRRKYVPYIYSQYRLAKEYGVTQYQICNIVNNKEWYWLYKREQKGTRNGNITRGS